MVRSGEERERGAGVCATFCDPTAIGACGLGYSCVEVGVAVVASAPVIHVCQVTSSDAGLPGFDSGGPGTADGGVMIDAAFLEGGGPNPILGR